MSFESVPAATPPRWRDVVAIGATGGFAGGGLLIGVAAGGRWLGMDAMAWYQGFWAEFMGFAVAIIPLFLLSFVGMILARRADLDVPEAMRIVFHGWWTV